jgi:hypothetical protein
MAYQWPNKDPDEVLDYSMDWSRFLGSATITTATWYVNDASNVKTLFTSGLVVNGLQNISQTITSQVATIHLGSGTANQEYTITCSILDSTGSVAERVVRLRIREQ